jgi:hypothetical protein
VHELRDLAIAAIRGVSVRHVDAARHKKTTHRFDRRLVESVIVSATDVIRLPNWAGFGTRGGIG